MKLFSSTESYKLYQGNMLDMLDVIEPNSIDAIVTDPPYELGFMGKSWDNSGVAFQKETWEKCLKVLKPGGYLLAFGGSRTHHRIMCAIEDAGFEIRDMICWIFGSGFPKSMNIGLAVDKKNGVESELGGVKAGHQDFVGRTTNGDTRFEDGMSGFDRPWMHNDEKREAYHYEKLPTSEEAKKWAGWGTQLKPAYESITVARKPCEGSCVDNVMKYGVGGINIDECRVGTDVITTNGARKNPMAGDERTGKALGMFQETEALNTDHTGRFPANVILTYDDTDFDEVCGGMPSRGANGSVSKTYDYKGEVFGDYKQKPPFDSYGDSGSAARYFYCAKASKRDRDEGLEAFLTQKTGDLQGGRQEGSAGSLRVRSDGSIGVNPYAGNGAPKKNTHPTVKPTDLMQYLVRLVTPPTAQC